MDQHEAFGLITHLEMYRTLHHLEMDVVSFFLHVQMLSTISFVTKSGCLIMIVHNNSLVSSPLPLNPKFLLMDKRYIQNIQLECNLASASS